MKSIPEAIKDIIKSVLSASEMEPRIGPRMGLIFVELIVLIGLMLALYAQESQLYFFVQEQFSHRTNFISAEGVFFIILYIVAYATIISVGAYFYKRIKNSPYANKKVGFPVVVLVGFVFLMIFFWFVTSL